MFANKLIKNLSILTFITVKDVGWVNQMIRDYSCQSTCDSSVLLVSLIILDLALVNARNILK